MHHGVPYPLLWVSFILERSEQLSSAQHQGELHKPVALASCSSDFEAYVPNTLGLSVFVSVIGEELPKP